MLKVQYLLIWPILVRWGGITWNGILWLGAHQVTVWVFREIEISGDLFKFRTPILPLLLYFDEGGGGTSCKYFQYLILIIIILLHWLCVIVCYIIQQVQNWFEF